MNKYFDPSSLILNLDIPFFLPIQLIGIILYLYFLEITFKGISKKILKLSEISGLIYNKTFFLYILKAFV